MRLAFEAGAPPAALAPGAPDAEIATFAPAAPLLATLGRQVKSDAARESLAALGEGRALVVVAGQQPCFPLPLGLSLLKTATAVAWARREAERRGGPVIPVFWSGGDDSDFEEARGQALLRATGGPLALRLPARSWRKGGFVGDLPIEDAWTELLALKGIGDSLAELAPRKGEDLGALECRLMAERFAPWGLLCLDARDEGMRLAAAPLYERYARKRREFAAAVDEAGSALEAAGEPRPLRRGLGERALFFLRRRRRSLPLAREYGERLEERLAGDPASLSPNAALRPLVQDAILPVAAAVLGPSEWDYHRQLREAFEILAIAFPPALPRLRLEWGPERSRLEDAGRRSSPLARPGHPLADPAYLVAVAEKHLDRWEAGQTGLFIHEGD